MNHISGALVVFGGFMFGAIVALPNCSARMICVEYEGAINLAGANASGFVSGDRVWGEYVYDDAAAAAASNWYGADYPTIRYLSMYTSGGFAGSLSYGVLNISPATYNRPLYSQHVQRGAEIFRLSSISPLPLYTQILDVFTGNNGRADDIDGDGHFGPNGYNLDDPAQVPDSNFFGGDRGDFDDFVVLPWYPPYMANGPALTQSAALTASLGSAPTSGAFAQEGLLAIDLFLNPGGPSGSVGADSRSLADFESAVGGRGLLSIGGYWSPAANQIEFEITKLTVVPEPATVGILGVAGFAAAILRRNRSKLSNT